MTQVAEQTGSKSFPFSLKDIRYFIVRRKDGLTIKYNIIDPPSGRVVNGSTALVPVSSTHQGSVSNITPTAAFSRWCQHKPADRPLFSSNKLDLYIADSLGFRQHYKEFSHAIDCGDILTAYQVAGGISDRLVGDRELVKALGKHVVKNVLAEPKILQIDWDDRRAPQLAPSFWPSIVKAIGEGVALIACQGGHGRSGTGAVCMMMVMNPEYSPADAIIHLRANHCARAIESKEQHEYIGKVGEFLGRKNDIERVGQVNNFKQEFLGLKHKSAIPYQEQLQADMDEGKVAKVDKGPEFDLT